MHSLFKQLHDFDYVNIPQLRRRVINERSFQFCGSRFSSYAKYISQIVLFVFNPFTGFILPKQGSILPKLRGLNNPQTELDVSQKRLSTCSGMQCSHQSVYIQPLAPRALKFIIEVKKAHVHSPNSLCSR